MFLLADIFALAFILASVSGSKCHQDYKLLRYQQQMNYLVGYLRREKLDPSLTRFANDALS